MFNYVIYLQWKIKQLEKKIKRLKKDNEQLRSQRNDYFNQLRSISRR